MLCLCSSDFVEEGIGSIYYVLLHRRVLSRSHRAVARPGAITVACCREVTYHHKGASCKPVVYIPCGLQPAEGFKCARGGIKKGELSTIGFALDYHLPPPTSHAALSSCARLLIPEHSLNQLAPTCDKRKLYHDGNHSRMPSNTTAAHGDPASAGCGMGSFAAN